jgi:hypothetical protein
VHWCHNKSLTSCLCMLLGQLHVSSGTVRWLPTTIAGFAVDYPHVSRPASLAGAPSKYQPAGPRALNAAAPGQSSRYNLIDTLIRDMLCLLFGSPGCHCPTHHFPTPSCQRSNWFNTSCYQAVVKNGKIFRLFHHICLKLQTASGGASSQQCQLQFEAG